MSGAPPPIVDVLVPAFNAERTIVEALGSIQRQTLQNIRILVVNDGSADRTAALVRDLAEHDRRIELLERPNGGIVAARNTTLEHSRARFLAMHDADDRSTPDRLERQLAYLEAHPDCVAVSGNSWYINEDGQRLGGRSGYGGDVRPDAWAFPSVEPYLPQPFAMIRRDAVLAVGGYRDVTNAEDTDLYWRLLSIGRLHNLPNILGEYRMHGISASAAAAKSGRLSAIGSQLSALSYRRRLEGEADFDLSPENAQAIAAVDDLEEMIAFVAPWLKDAELGYLRVAAAAKLLEMASYRPYLLSVRDCHYIRGELSAVRRDRPMRDLLRIAYQEAHILRRLIANQRWAEAQALGASPVIYAATLPALAARHIKAMLQSRS